MCGRGAGAILDSVLRPAGVTRAGRSSPHRPRRTRQETAMERTDWLDAGLDSAGARFLMLTAITHHHFSSPIWGEHLLTRARRGHLAELLPGAAGTGSQMLIVVPPLRGLASAMVPPSASTR